MIDNSKTSKVKLMQFRNLAILAGIVSIVFLSLIYMMSGSTTKELNSANDKANFANPLEHVDPESVVLERTQKQLHDTENKTEQLQRQINSLTAQC